MFGNRFDEFSDFFESNDENTSEIVESRFDTKFNDFFSPEVNAEFNHEYIRFSYNRSSHFSTLNYERCSITVSFNNERHND